MLLSLCARKLTASLQVKAASVLLSIGLLDEVLAVLLSAQLPELASFFVQACREHGLEALLEPLADGDDEDGASPTQERQPLVEQARTQYGEYLARIGQEAVLKTPA